VVAGAADRVAGHRDRICGGRIPGLAGLVHLCGRARSPSDLGQFDPDRRCGPLGFSCGAITNILTSVLLIALATFFLLWRIFGLVRQYRGRARADSRELVPTAGTILDDVVGRDELCQVVMADLHERRMRPHVLVGGVGTGKTAVLVRLTEMLADKHAIPVPVRLRDARETLDFEAMAQERFLGEVNQRLISLAEGETIWRRLRSDNRIVVLADGLEEALVGNSAEQERDNIIRAAIRKAHQQRLPLVIASRPHDPLRATVAAILALEPLSYEAALAYIGNDGSREDERRLAWIVETADVVEAPLYLQITRELKAKGLLDPSAGGRRGVVDTRGVDRSKLRLALLETWQRALISGYLREEVPLNQAERLAAFEHMSALACVGLKTDKLEVEFAELEPEERLSAEVQARLAKVDGDAWNTSGVQNIDVRLAAARAGQLDLVELRGQRVRFPHSLIQAYLGSRLLDVALADPGYCEQALKHPGPGREFLIAMVLRSRANDAAGMWQPDPAGAAAAGARQARRKKTPARANVQQRYVDPLRKAAGKRDDNKVLDMYAAALEIDCGAAEPAHRAIADKIKAQWPRIHAQEPRTLDEGKLLLVRRFGDAARRIDDRRRHGEANLELPAYRELYEIACLERSYPVKLAAAQEIGVGGDSAYQELSAVLAAPCPICHSERSERLERAEVSASRSAISSSAEKIISAWLAPMLVGSVGATGSAQSAELADQAQADLDQWLRHVGRYGRRPGEEDLDITLEIGIAQGFKYAANRRPANPDIRQELRMHLAEQAPGDAEGHRVLVLPADPDPGAVPAQPVRRGAASGQQARRQARGHRAALARRGRPRRYRPQPAHRHARRAASVRPRGSPARGPGPEDRLPAAVPVDRRERRGRQGGLAQDERCDDLPQAPAVDSAVGWVDRAGRTGPATGRRRAAAAEPRRPGRPAAGQRAAAEAFEPTRPAAVHHPVPAVPGPRAHRRHRHVVGAGDQLRGRVPVRAVPVSAQGDAVEDGDERGVLPSAADAADTQVAGAPPGSLAGDAAWPAHRLLGRDGRPRPRSAA
jgi:NACHT domain